MDVTINTITSPGNCGHVVVNVTVGGQSRNVRFLRSDLQLEPDDLETAFIGVCRHICKTEGYTTANQIKNGLEGLMVKL